LSGVLLLRHGQSTWNAQQRWQGHGDPSLTELGRDQARAAAAQLASAGIERVVSSDLARAFETAAIVAAALGLAVLRDARWRERDIGSWTGFTREEIEARWPEEYARFRSHDESARPGGGESDAMLRARAHEALKALRARYPGERVLVVTHRGIARMLGAETPLGNAEWCEVGRHP
jgi:broad specificity phosphatase PhoE